MKWHRLKYVSIVVVALATLAPLRVLAETNNTMAAALESITSDELYRHVEILADDVYEGRAAGSRGGQAAARYLVEQLKANGMQPAGDNGDFAQVFKENRRNLLALLPGDDPKLESEVLVVGAHYDHVGYGKKKNNGEQGGQIHNGADDNASGTAALLEIVQAFAKTDLKTRRSILFAFWDSEEIGLVGSRHWAANPTLPLERVKFDVTIDMIGRLRDEKLLVLGTRSGYGLRRLFCDSADEPLSLEFSWDLSGNSDHWPFIEHQIPAALIHTGLHSDYHKPTDDAEKINREGMQEVGRFVMTSIVKLANEDRLPTFRKAVRTESERVRREFEKPLEPASLDHWPADEPRPRLGITWREDEAEPGTVLLIRVVEGTPAANAKLAAGDRLLEFNGKPFADGAALRTGVNAALEAGEKELKFIVERRGHTQTIVVKMASDSQ